jgi:hypothetical protein
MMKNIKARLNDRGMLILVINPNTEGDPTQNGKSTKIAYTNRFEKLKVEGLEDLNLMVMITKRLETDPKKITRKPRAAKMQEEDDDDTPPARTRKVTTNKKVATKRKTVRASSIDDDDDDTQVVRQKRNKAKPPTEAKLKKKADLAKSKRPADRLKARRG